VQKGRRDLPLEQRGFQNSYLDRRSPLLRSAFAIRFAACVDQCLRVRGVILRAAGNRFVRDWHIEEGGIAAPILSLRSKNEQPPGIDVVADPLWSVPE